MSEEFNIRALSESDWEAFRDIRLKALADHPGVYGSTLAREQGFSESQWRESLSRAGSKVFGLFDKDRMAGVCGAFDSAEYRAAVLYTWYLRGEYRGRGLFKALAQASIDWAKASSGYDRIVVFHREGNEGSRRANQSLGFVYTGREWTDWADGGMDYEYAYEMRIR